MAQMKQRPTPVKHPMRKLMRKFGRDENGSILVFSIFLIVIMLILGGMSVDFMRFEARRSKLQDVSDRAALAGANLRNSNSAAESKAIAIDYFVKAGLDQYIVGEPMVIADANYRSVQINAEMELSTYFLRLVGINKLDAGSASRAIEGVGNVEISLVVDISGSMGYAAKDAYGNSTGQSKMEALRDAATAFTDDVLHSDYAGKISLSLVPYSQQVNAGPVLFNRLSTDHRHNFSHCIEFPDSAFGTAALDLNYTYTQGQHVQTNPGGENEVTEPVCPRYPYERITHVSQNRTAINQQIAALRPRAGTSIFLGLKWGVALLDPSTRPLIASGLDPAFVGRPYDYPNASNPDSRTEKVVVLMTDGDNQWSNYLYDEFYDTPSEIAHWDEYNFDYYRRYYASNTNSSHWTYVRYSAPAYPYPGQSDGDVLTRNLCTAAKDKGITIFTIAFEATAAGEALMAECASTPSHYYPSSGGELTAIFEAIAAQITDLRLTL